MSVDEVQAADLTDLWQEARQIVRLKAWTKMKVTEGHRSTHYVGLAEWDG
jgi:hypothetical protein